MAYKEVVKETIYINNMCQYFNRLYYTTSIPRVPVILTDSESAIKLANNPEFHKRSKHIDITYHFIRDSIVNKQVELIFVPTKD